MGHVYNLKHSLKFKLLAFSRKQTPSIDQKCTYEKVTKKLGRSLSLPPSFGQNPKEQQLFFVTPSLMYQRSKKREDNFSFLFTSLFQLQLIGWHPILVFLLITSFWHYAFSSLVASFNQKSFVTVSHFFHFSKVFPLQKIWGAILDPMTVWGSWMWCWMCWM